MLALIVAIATLQLFHEPPVTASASVVVYPLQISVTPVMLAGIGLTVIVVVMRHPVARL